MTHRVIIGASISHELAEQIKAQADQNDRTLSAEIRRALREYMVNSNAQAAEASRPTAQAA